MGLVCRAARPPVDCEQQSKSRTAGSLALERGGARGMELPTVVLAGASVPTASMTANSDALVAAHDRDLSAAIDAAHEELRLETAAERHAAAKDTRKRQELADRCPGRGRGSLRPRVRLCCIQRIAAFWVAARWRASC